LPRKTPIRFISGSNLIWLGFSQTDLEKPPHEFSGGFQIRVNLAKLLLSDPNLLLLDEPTNYLDITSVRWIAKFLTNFKGELILISHDRDFMDSVTTHTAVIHRKKSANSKASTAKAYAQIVLEDEIHEKTRANEDKKRAHAEAFIDRFRAQASKPRWSSRASRCSNGCPNSTTLPPSSRWISNLDTLPLPPKPCLRHAIFRLATRRPSPVSADQSDHQRTRPIRRHR
jgi:ATPase subunit of ABC transporter with duplicated ATPase domains